MTQEEFEEKCHEELIRLELRNRTELTERIIGVEATKEIIAEALDLKLGGAPRNRDYEEWFAKHEATPPGHKKQVVADTARHFEVGTASVQRQFVRMRKRKSRT